MILIAIVAYYASRALMAHRLKMLDSIADRIIGPPAPAE